jgi:glyoxylase-like metal-dependent hydrolase (beta-lactamase superfamily II)
MGISTTGRILVGVIAVLAVASNAPGQAAAPRRSIEQANGAVYTASNNNHRTVFMVTSEGIIVGDPINADFAKWLKAELATRFKVPVRYVVYSHHHWDHASGGEVFANTAKFVGHANMVTALTTALPNTKDGTGVDASAFTGVGKWAAGVHAASTIVNAHISAAAAIDSVLPRPTSSAIR